MARVSTYLNFNNKTEEAFRFYRSVFGGEFTSLQRFEDIPGLPGLDRMSEADSKGIMHIELPILGGHVLMGTDAPESMGFRMIPGNNVYVNLEPDSRTEADTIFAALSTGGTVETEFQEMFWGGYCGSFSDRYGVRWMINCPS